MNTVELKKLRDPHLSHLSRSLYAFFLRPAAVMGEYRVDLGAVCNYLYSDSNFFPTPADQRSARLCLCELELCGLIRRDSQEENWEGAMLKFPCFENELAELPARPFAMSKDWHPGPGFREACLLCGLEESTFSAQELAGFTGYWAAKPEVRTQSAWERTFALRLGRRRSAKTAPARALKPQTQINYALAATPRTRAAGLSPEPAAAGPKAAKPDADGGDWPGEDWQDF